MKVYFEQVENDRVTYEGYEYYDYPRESDTLMYVIREKVKAICENHLETDAIILNIYDTVKGNVLVQYRSL